MKNLREQAEGLLISSGCDIVGFANVEKFKGRLRVAGPRISCPPDDR